MNSAGWQHRPSPVAAYQPIQIVPSLPTPEPDQTLITRLYRPVIFLASRSWAQSSRRSGLGCIRPAVEIQVGQARGLVRTMTQRQIWVLRKAYPWSDYGSILVHGMSGHLARSAGRIQSERTGPFIPPLLFQASATSWRQCAPERNSNDQWRICFRWFGADAHDVEIVDYH